MLDAKAKEEFLKQFEQNIIATDLKIYLLKHRTALNALFPAGRSSTFDFHNQSHMQMLNGLIMAAAEMHGLSKHFIVAERIAGNVFKEYYVQGDRERAMGRTPLPKMRRDLGFMLPEWEVRFLRVVTIPCFELLQKILPNTSTLFENAKYGLRVRYVF